MLISVDLMWEWLVVASGKMMAMEYATCLATFIFIMVAGIETGKSVCLSVYLSVCLSRIHSLLLSSCNMDRKHSIEKITFAFISSLIFGTPLIQCNFNQ